MSRTVLISVTLVSLGLVGCAKSTPSVSSSAPSSAGAPSAPSAAAAYTIAAAAAPGLGTILVNGDGRALYILTSVQGTPVPCTDASGCTKIWPDTELPAGVLHPIAGAGIRASLLTTIKESSGHLYIAYGGRSLYLFSGDNGPGMANGQGIKSFGGTWWVMGADGKPITTAGTSSSSSATVPGY